MKQVLGVLTKVTPVEVQVVVYWVLQEALLVLFTLQGAAGLREEQLLCQEREHDAP